MAKRNMITDDLKEFKPRYKGAIFGVRNGSHTVYVWDLGREPESWEGRRYKVSKQFGDEVTIHGEYDTVEKAKDAARSAVRGMAFRYLLRRMNHED